MTNKIAYCVWNKEKSEAKLLKKLREGYGYEAFFPVRKRVLRNSQHILIDEVPLTPGYVFFYADEPIDEDKLNWLKQYYCWNIRTAAANYRMTTTAAPCGCTDTAAWSACLRA